MKLNGPIQIGNVQRFTATPGLSPKCLFIKVGCHMPNECRPCIENTDGVLQIQNNGDLGECAIAYQIKGENYLLWSGDLDTGEGVIVELIIHFPTEDFPESEIVEVKFFAGYIISENQMAITDEIDYELFVYVKKINWTQIAIIGGIAVGGVGIVYSFFSAKRGGY